MAKKDEQVTLPPPPENDVQDQDTDEDEGTEDNG